MHANALLAEIGRNLGLGSLAFDEHNLCRLVFDRTMDVDLEWDPDSARLHLYAALCPIPPEGREALYAELLAANLFGQGTGQASFAMDRDLHEILLVRTFELDRTDAIHVQNGLESFIDHLAAWRKMLEVEGVGQSAKDRGANVLEPRPGEMFLRG